MLLMLSTLILDPSQPLIQLVSGSRGVHPISYPVGTGGSFPVGKAAGA
jgi:hypothetical protein